MAFFADLQIHSILYDFTARPKRRYNPTIEHLIDKKYDIIIGVLTPIIISGSLTSQQTQEEDRWQIK